MEYAFKCIFSVLTKVVMKMARYKKICYIPGAISLLILPILFVAYVDIGRRARTYYVLPVVMRNEVLEKKNPAIFFGEYPNNKRNYEDINITGVSGSDQVKLAYSQIRIREVLQQNNLVQGIHYHFGDSSNYGAFVKALNILQIENAQRYVVEDNNIWFYDVPPDTARHDQLIDCMFCSNVIYLKSEPQKGVLTMIMEAWNSSWLLIVSFSLLLFVSLGRLRSTLRAR